MLVCRQVGSRIVGAVVCVLVLFCSAFFAPQLGRLWFLLTTEMVYDSDFAQQQEVRCPVWRNRWTKESVLEPPGWVTAYYVESGFKAYEYETHGEGLVIRETRWRSDGTVLLQRRELDDQNNPLHTPGETKTRPPWWWEAADQEEPSAPWVRP